MLQTLQDDMKAKQDADNGRQHEQIQNYRALDARLTLLDSKLEAINSIVFIDTDVMSMKSAGMTTSHKQSVVLQDSQRSHSMMSRIGTEKLSDNLTATVGRNQAPQQF